MSTAITPRMEIGARRIAGDLAERIVGELQEAAAALEAQFHRFGADVEITIGTEPDKPLFRIVVGWTRGVGPAGEPWDQVFNFSLSTMLQLHRTMAGDVGLQVAERMWNELAQFELPR